MKIKKFENQDTEFKESWRDEYLKWICAFANTHGGVLYVGVDDEGTICGVKDSHKLSEDIPNKIKNTMGLICEVNLLEDNNLAYFQIIVQKYPFPVSYHGKYYKRTGSTTQELTGNELDKMILHVHGRTWDSVPVPNVSVEDLENDAIRLFKKMSLDYNRMDESSLAVSNKVLLQNLHLMENDYLTKAAVMCFHPDPEKWVNSAYIKIGYFADEADIRFQDEIHGPLILQVQKAMDLIYTKYMKALISYDGIHRKETFFFPKEAFRELLLNAVIHKDYMESNPIQIKIYKDKIRIWNIGEMPADLSASNLFQEHASKPRNPNIANVFFKSGYVESWGRGYKNIESVCKERNAILPKPQETNGGLAVECYAYKEFFALKTDSNTAFPETAQKLPRNCPEIAQKTFEAIKINPKATIQQLSVFTGVSERTIKSHQSLLKEAGLIRRVGSDRAGHWEIITGE